VPLLNPVAIPEELEKMVSNKILLLSFLLHPIPFSFMSRPILFLLFLSEHTLWK
jgi:hypothetical protein